MRWGEGGREEQAGVAGGLPAPSSLGPRGHPRGAERLQAAPRGLKDRLRKAWT